MKRYECMASLVQIPNQRFAKRTVDGIVHKNYSKDFAALTEMYKKLRCLSDWYAIRQAHKAVEPLWKCVALN